MKLINSGAELLTQGDGLLGIYKMIELAGRTCYKSEANITADSAAEFVGRMIKSNHTAMLEHGTVYLLIPYWNSYDETDLASFFRHNPYSKAWGPTEDSVNWHITTNYRVLVENNLVEKCKPYICSPTKHHSLRISMRFTANIHFYKDITRHRHHSYAIESTRWIDYLKEKYGMSLTFLKPVWLKEEDSEEFQKDCEILENLYFKWRNRGWKPEEAAYFLGQGTAATVVITGFASDWHHLFNLRYFGTTGRPHITVLDMMSKAKAVLEKAGLWSMIMSS